MANKNTPTARENFVALLAYVKGNDTLTAFINRQIEKLDNKANSARAKKTEADEKYCTAIAEVLADGKSLRATDILKALAPDFADLTVQKVTSVLGKMIATGEVVKTVDKKVSTFALAVGE